MRKTDELAEKRKNENYKERGGEEWATYIEKKIGLAPISCIPGKSHDGLMSFSLGVKLRNGTEMEFKTKNKVSCHTLFTRIYIQGNKKKTNESADYYGIEDVRTTLRGYVLGISENLAIC